jgi:hypothetical protein
MRHLNRPIIAAILALASLAPPLSAQGVPMSPDFLPLEVGNLWRFDIRDAAGRLTGRFEIEILEHQIVGGFSLYVLSRFPLRGQVRVSFTWTSRPATKPAIP